MTETTLPERVIVNLDARGDLITSDDLYAGIRWRDAADPRTWNEGPSPEVEQEARRRVARLDAAYRAEARSLAAEMGIEIEVRNVHEQEEEQVGHPIDVSDPDGETWEDRIGQQIRARTPTLDARTRLAARTAERRETVAHTDLLWRESIVRALTEDVGATEVAKLAGISRERVYQIRDGRR